MSGHLERQLETLHADSFGWALACCDRERERAEDVLQSAYLKVLDGRARFDGRSEIKTWLFGVIRHTAAEQRRRRLVRGGLLRRWFGSREPASPTPDPESLAGDDEARRRIHELLARLSRRQRELLHLVFYQELTIEQASAVLGIGVGSARTHYERGKRRLRALLATQEQDDATRHARRSSDSRAVHAKP